MNVPAWCANEDGDCDASYAIEGTVRDTVGELPDVDWLPFYNAAPVCDDGGVNCGNLWQLAWVADSCNLTDFGQVEGWLRDFEARFTAIADAFAFAGTDPGMQFVMPHDGIFAMQRDLPFNQADALVLAAATRGAAASFAATDVWTWVDATSRPEDFVDVYEADGWSCNTEDFLGIETSVAQVELDTWFAQARAGATLEEVADILVMTLDHALEATATAPLADGMLDFSDVRGRPDTRFRDSVVTDVTAVRDGLRDRSTKTLPSAPSWRMFGAMLADPAPDADSIEAEMGVGSIFTTYDRRCFHGQTEIDEALADWFATGGGLVDVPEDDSYPEAFDLAENAIDDDGWWYFLQRETIESLLGR
jgi:hypothetical protein